MAISRGPIIRRCAAVVAIAGAAWTALLAATGGFDFTLGGLEVSAHDPFRPLLWTSFALTLFLLFGGKVPSPVRQAHINRMLAFVGRVFGAAFQYFALRTGVLAVALALATAGVGWVWSAKAVGGADSYGYLSQSDLWASGSLRVRQPIAAEVPFPGAGWAFAPVGSYKPMHGYRRVEGEDRWTMVPVYPPGLPLLLAAAGFIGGFQAKFAVIPLMGGLMVLATYGIGARLISRGGGLIAAWLVATSPTLLFLMVPIMSDAVAAGLWTFAFYLALSPSPARAAATGLIASIAVLVRPNLAPLAALLGLLFLLRLRDQETRGRAVRSLVLFALSGIPAAAVLALTNRSLYGSPFAAGYGTMQGFFSTSHIMPNIRQYFVWLAETQTPIALAGFVAALIPSRRLWPGAERRSTLVVMALFLGTIWCSYFIYTVFDAWWYLRFLLPSFFIIMLGVGAIGAALMRWRKGLTPLVVIGAIALGLYQFNVAIDRGTFSLWALDRRYVSAARMTRQLTPRDSIIITGQHVGSVRYYGSRLSAHYDFISRAWIDRAVAWFAAHDLHPYLLAESWEMDAMREHFLETKVEAVLDGPPIAVYETPGRMYLFDLAPASPPSQPPALWVGVDDGIWGAPPVQPPRLDVAR